MPSHTVENYLKTIYRLSTEKEGVVHTNAISEALGTKAATVSDMLKKLDEQGMIEYRKYQGVTLTKSGLKAAIDIVRRHRLWEVFLVEKLDFAWHEVHDLAEELEHIKSDALIERLDRYLGHPRFDPHGDAIPDSNGHMAGSSHIPLAELPEGRAAVVAGVKDSSNEFLRFLDNQGIGLGSRVVVNSVFDYDKSRSVAVNDSVITLGAQACKNLLVKAE